jgi:hypothetical protein
MPKAKKLDKETLEKLHSLVTEFSVLLNAIFKKD